MSDKKIASSGDPASLCTAAWHQLETARRALVASQQRVPSWLGDALKALADGGHPKG